MILGIRPEDLEDAELEPDRPAERRLAGEVELTEALGSEIMVHFTIDATPARSRTRCASCRRTRARRSIAPQAEGERRDAWSAVSARARRRAEGEPVEVAVDTRALHFFDPETGLGIYDGTKGDA